MLLFNGTFGRYSERIFRIRTRWVGKVERTASLFAKKNSHHPLTSADDVMIIAAKYINRYYTDCTICIMYIKIC